MSPKTPQSGFLEEAKVGRMKPNSSQPRGKHPPVANPDGDYTTYPTVMSQFMSTVIQQYFRKQPYLMNFIISIYCYFTVICSCIDSFTAYGRYCNYDIHSIIISS